MTKLAKSSLSMSRKTLENKSKGTLQEIKMDLIKEANTRIKRLKKSKVYNYSDKTLLQHKSALQNPTFRTKKSTLIRDIRELQSFIKSEGSTVKGIKERNKATNKRFSELMMGASLNVYKDSEKRKKFSNIKDTSKREAKINAYKKKKISEYKKKHGKVSKISLSDKTLTKFWKLYNRYSPLYERTGYPSDQIQKLMLEAMEDNDDINQLEDYLNDKLDIIEKRMEERYQTEKKNEIKLKKAATSKM